MSHDTVRALAEHYSGAALAYEQRWAGVLHPVSMRAARPAAAAGCPAGAGRRHRGGHAAAGPAPGRPGRAGRRRRPGARDAAARARRVPARGHRCRAASVRGRRFRRRRARVHAVPPARSGRGRARGGPGAGAGRDGGRRGVGGGPAGAGAGDLARGAGPARRPEGRQPGQPARPGEHVGQAGRRCSTPPGSPPSTSGRCRGRTGRAGRTSSRTAPSWAWPRGGSSGWRRTPGRSSCVRCAAGSPAWATTRSQMDGKYSPALPAGRRIDGGPPPRQGVDQSAYRGVAMARKRWLGLVGAVIAAAVVVTVPAAEAAPDVNNLNGSCVALQAPNGKFVVRNVLGGYQATGSAPTSRSACSAPGPRATCSTAPARTSWPTGSARSAC